MTATHPNTTHPIRSMPGSTPTVPLPAPSSPRKFWIAPDGKTVAADAAEVQALVDAGRADLDIQSQNPGSVWTKPAALGFVAKPVLPVPKPTPIVPVQPPAAPTDWPTSTVASAEMSTTAETCAPVQPKATESAETQPPSTPASTPSSKPFVFMEFATAIVIGDQAGARFRLADGRTIASPIPEADVPITADIVRQALTQTEKEYKRRGQVPDSMNLVEIQEAVVVQAAVLNFQAKLNGGPVSRYLIQFGTAVADFQHTLHIVINSSEE